MAGKIHSQQFRSGGGRLGRHDRASRLSILIVQSTEEASLICPLFAGIRTAGVALRIGSSRRATAGREVGVPQCCVTC